MLTSEHKQKRVELSQQCLCRYEKNGDEFLKKVVTCDETWVHGVEAHRLIQVPPVHKEGDAHRFLDMQGPIMISFLEKGSTVNSANYCKLLRQVKKDIKNKHRDHQSEGFILHHENARPHTAAQTLQIINKLGWKLLPHLPHSPGLANFHQFGPLKAFMRSTKFESDNEGKSVVSDWLRHQFKDFYTEGIQKLVHRWKKWVTVLGEKKKKVSFYLY